MIVRSYDGQKYAWCCKSKEIARLRKKGEGRGVMVSGFINRKEGFLSVTEEQLRKVNEKRGRGNEVKRMETVDIGEGKKTYSFCYFNYGQHKEGYWDSDDMIEQTQDYIDLWEVKYGTPAEGGGRLLLWYDWSSGHSKMPETAWNPREMNIKPGGGGASAEAVRKMSPRIRVMRAYPLPIPLPCWSQHAIDEWMASSEYNKPNMIRNYPDLKSGDYQELFFKEGEFPYWLDPRTTSQPTIDSYLGQPKGLRQLLFERGLWRPGMTLDGGRTVRGVRQPRVMELSAKDVMAEQQDIAKQKSALQLSIEKRGHYCIFLPKYHCELNPIENVWAKCKRYVREHCMDDYDTMLRLIPEGLLGPNLPVHFIREYYRRADDYLAVYGLTDAKGVRLCPTSTGYGQGINDMREAYKSHRRPPPSECDLGEDGKPKKRNKPWDIRKAMEKAAEDRAQRQLEEGRGMEEERGGEEEEVRTWDEEEREIIEVDDDDGDDYGTPGTGEDFEREEDIQEVDFDQILANIDWDDC